MRKCNPSLAKKSDLVDKNVRHMKVVLVIIAAAVIGTGCAQSSGVLQMGPDTYTVSVHAAPARGGVTGARQLAFEEASRKCLSLDRQMLVTNETSGRSTHLPGGTVEIVFQCLAAGDPDLRRPSYRPAPNAVIETRP